MIHGTRSVQSSATSDLSLSNRYNPSRGHPPRRCRHNPPAVELCWTWVSERLASQRQLRPTKERRSLIVLFRLVLLILLFLVRSARGSCSFPRRLILSSRPIRSAPRRPEGAKCSPHPRHCRTHLTADLGPLVLRTRTKHQLAYFS